MKRYSRKKNKFVEPWFLDLGVSEDAIASLVISANNNNSCDPIQVILKDRSNKDNENRNLCDCKYGRRLRIGWIFLLGFFFLSVWTL
jgi:hypothetical protein